MAYTQSTPGFDRLRQELDRWFEAARIAGERTLDAVGLASETRPLPPATDVIETETDIHFLVDLPGIGADGVDLALAGQVLTLKAIRIPSPLLTEDAAVHLRERLSTTFERTFPVPAQVDPDSVRAVVRDGVLHVTLKKIHTSTSRQIPIQRGGEAESPEAL